MALLTPLFEDYDLIMRLSDIERRADELGAPYAYIDLATALMIGDPHGGVRLLQRLSFHELAILLNNVPDSREFDDQLSRAAASGIQGARFTQIRYRLSALYPAVITAGLMLTIVGFTKLVYPYE